MQTAQVEGPQTQTAQKQLLHSEAVPIKEETQCGMSHEVVTDIRPEVFGNRQPGTDYAWRGGRGEPIVSLISR